MAFCPWFRHKSSDVKPEKRKVPPAKVPKKEEESSDDEPLVSQNLRSWYLGSSYIDHMRAQ